MRRPLHVRQHIGCTVSPSPAKPRLLRTLPSCCQANNLSVSKRNSRVYHLFHQRAGGRTTLPLAVKLTNDILCDTGPRAGVFAIDQTILKSSGSGKLSYRRKLNTVRTILRLLAAAVLSAMQRSVLPSVL